MKKVSFKIIGILLCSMLSINVMADVTINGINYSLTAGNRTASVTGSSLANIVVPETIVYDGVTYSVTDVSDQAFLSSKTINYFKASNTIKTIGKYAFRYSSIKKIYLGNSVETIEDYAFDACTELPYVVLPKSIENTINYNYHSFQGSYAIICLREGFNTGHPNRTIYPSSFFTWDSNTEYTYNGQTPQVSYSFNGIGFGFQPTGSPVVTNLDPTAGTHTANVQFTISNTDMSFDVSYDFLYTVNPATLTAKVKDAQRKYGDANPSFSSTYSGFVNGENSSVITNNGTYSVTATTNSDVGTYVIKQSGAKAKNYVFNYEDGKLTITKAPLTVTANDKTITYGSTIPKLDVSYKGLKNNESQPEWITSPQLSTTATSKSNVGTYPITITGAEAKNYIITIVKGVLTIEKAPLKLSALNNSRLYGDVNPKLTYTCIGFKGNDNTNVLTTKPTLKTTANLNSPVGRYPIEISGAKALNYTISYENGIMTVNKRKLTVTTQNYTRKYGENNPTFQLTYSGFANNETENVLQRKPQATTNATKTSDVGEYNITIGNGVAENYNFNYIGAKLTIEKAYQTLEWIQDLSWIGQYSQIELLAKASSGLDVSYTIEGANICSVIIVGSKKYLDCFGEGEAVIYAIQDGNKNYWQTTKIYKQIKILSPTGIDSISMECDDNAKIYDMQGRRISSLRKGTNIVKMSDGTTKKVFVK